MSKKQPKSAKPAFKVDENGYGSLPAFEHFMLPEEDLAPGAVIDGNEIYILRLVDDKASEALAVTWVEGDPNVSSWIPSAPEGDDWALSAICETDEGPFAVFARPTGDAKPTGRAYAQEFLLGAMIKAATKHLKTLSKSWFEMTEAEQKRTMEFVHRDCREAVRDAIDIIASNGRLTFTAAVDQVVFKDGVKAVLSLAKTHYAHSLADAEGSFVTIVIEDRSVLLQEGDALKVDADQKPLFEQESNDDNDQDALYDKAVEAVRKHNKPNISFLQRHLQIGYNRAARLMEEMEANDVVSPMDAGGTRVVVELEAA